MARKLITLLSLLDTVANAAVVPLKIDASGSAKPHAVFTATLPRETGKFGAESDYPMHSAQTIAERQVYANQIPFVFCPEDFGKPPKNCDLCGGDSYHHGICNNLLLSGRQTNDCLRTGYECQGYYCQCTHDGNDHNPQVTSSTVVDGQTGTVIYEPLTLTQYSNLRSHTTVTLTEVATATSTDEAGSLETALAVVFAGGIAWIAVSESGGAAAIAAIQPPNKKPEDAKDDDSSCKSNPEEECAKCGGSDGHGLCSSGDQAGCPCEEKQNCPNEPPRCSDTQCGGDNGQSQCSAPGEIKGCTCCPDNPLLCSDKNCVGGNLQLCTEAKWNQCGCFVEADAGELDEENESSGITDPKALSSSISSVAAFVFTDIWSANYTKLIGYPTPTEPPNPCTTETLTATIPGRCGVPGCAYVLASNLGPGALCSADYCNCGGVVAPLLTTVVSDSTSLNCNYTTQPGSASCPAGSTTTDHPTTTDYPTTTTQTTTTTTMPPIKTPPPNTNCSTGSDCAEWTCPPDGTPAICLNGAAGDPFTSLCVCHD
ncbi:hypothetical protein F4679DRAFT_587457 [Xylaria curta]|nr:hypothetical protein F4679DRAFT_587457 [Xylaria curta]